jgi:serine/threonine protein kinase
MAVLEENTVIGPYRIIRKLGQGGMGAVYEALHQSLGRHVAIKVLHPEVARNEEFAIRFANEARASNIVDHPDVVQITDHGQLPDGIPYIVMEYLKGESLGHRIEHLGGPMNPSEVAFLALQMSDVLAVAHARGIIHRDLKPENIMLMPDASTATGERAKVLDFGIAKLIEANNQGAYQTRATELLGTPNYMSPEQCRGAKGVDEKTDVYALGVMMFEMLTGRPPFIGSALGELMAKHMYEPAQKVATVNPQVPEPLASLVDLLLDKDKDKRPTMEQLETQLEQLTSELPPPPKHRHRPSGAMALVQSGHHANPDAKTIAGSTPGTTGVIERSRRSRLLLLGAIAVLLIGGGVTGYLVLRKKAVTSVSVEKKKVRWRLRSVPAGAQVVRRSDGAVLGQTPLAREAEQSSEPLLLRLESVGHLPHDVQLSLETSSEVQVVLHPEPPKPAVEMKPAAEPESKPKPKPAPTVKKPQRPRAEEPHIEN